jgi:lipoate-protein ligase A
VGEAWAAALGELGVSAEVHRGPLVRSEWSTEVCFAGLGPGEVTVDGRKVVGISQRRTRAAARFQCAALGRWDPAAAVTLLGLPPRAAEDLRGAAAGVGRDLELLLAALLRHLP